MLVAYILRFIDMVLLERHSCPLKKAVNRGGVSIQAGLNLSIFLPQPPGLRNTNVCYHVQLLPVLQKKKLYIFCVCVIILFYVYGCFPACVRLVPEKARRSPETASDRYLATVSFEALEQSVRRHDPPSLDQQHIWEGCQSQVHTTASQE